MDYDSITNQRIKDKFVGREVIGCFTSEVNYILGRYDRDAPFEYDDIENYYSAYCSNCGNGYTNISTSEDEEGNPAYTCDDCDTVYTQDEYDSLETQPREVYEWWAVTNWFGEKLRNKGECVIQTYFRTYWGRCATGQAILLDYVVSKTCEDLGILMGRSIPGRISPDRLPGLLWIRAHSSLCALHVRRRNEYRS